MPLFDYNLKTSGVPEIKELERKVEEIGVEIINSLKEIKTICAVMNFKKISDKASAVFELLIHDVLNLFNRGSFNGAFMKACENVSFMKRIYSVKVMLDYSKWDPLTSSMESDPFHKFSTMDKTRLRIQETANILAFIEVFRLKFANKSTEAVQHMQAEAALEAVEEVEILLKDHMAEYEQTKYFTKADVQFIVNDVMTNDQSGDDKAKALALLNALMEVHTSTRFVVAVYNEQCDPETIVAGDKDNLLTDAKHRTIVYMSTYAINMTKDKEEYNLTIERFKGDPYYCETLTAKIIRAHYREEIRKRKSTKEMTINGGFMIIRHDCGIVIEHDRRTPGLKDTTFVCRPSRLTEALSQGEKVKITASSYPA